MTANGIKYPDEEAQSLFRTIEGNNYQVSRYSKPIGKGTFKIDPAANPKTIDSAPATDPSKLILGIYEFDGKAWRICNATPGKPRPTDFEAKTGSGHTVTRVAAGESLGRFARTTRSAVAPLAAGGDWQPPKIRLQTNLRNGVLNVICRSVIIGRFPGNRPQTVLTTRMAK